MFILSPPWSSTSHKTRRFLQKQILSAQHDVVPFFRQKDVLKDEELLLRLLLSADVELLHVPATWSRLGLGQHHPGDSFLMSLSFCSRCEERVPGSLQNAGSLLRAFFDLDDLHHLHVSHHGDGRRCPKVTLSFMFLSLILPLKDLCCETNIPQESLFASTSNLMSPLPPTLQTLLHPEAEDRVGLISSFVVLPPTFPSTPSLPHGLDYPPVGLGSYYITEQ